MRHAICLRSIWRGEQMVEIELQSSVSWILCPTHRSTSSYTRIAIALLLKNSSGASIGTRSCSAYTVYTRSARRQQSFRQHTDDIFPGISFSVPSDHQCKRVGNGAQLLGRWATGGTMHAKSGAKSAGRKLLCSLRLSHRMRIADRYSAHTGDVRWGRAFHQ